MVTWNQYIQGKPENCTYYFKFHHYLLKQIGLNMIHLPDVKKLLI